MIDKSYKTEDIIIGKHNIHLFKMVNPRRFRNTQLKNIKRALDNREHFENPIAINIRKCEWRIIDGNHRIFVIRDKILPEDPSFMINTSIDMYENLTDAEENRIYSIRAKPVRQTINDYINAYRHEIKMMDRIIDELPCDIYGSKNKMSVKAMVEAYMCASSGTMLQGFSGSPDEFVRYMKAMDNKMVDKMSEVFWIIYEVFNPNKYKDFMALSAFKTCPYYAIYRIAFENYHSGKYNRKQLMQKLRRANKANIMEKLNFGGYKSRLHAYKILKEVCFGGDT